MCKSYRYLLSIVIILISYVSVYSDSSSANISDTPEPKYLIPKYKMTGNNCNVILTFRQASVLDGWEIGILNQLDEIVGSGVIVNSKVGLAVWGDNSMTTAIDGAKTGELMKVILLDTTLQKRYNIELSNIFDKIFDTNYVELKYRINSVDTAEAFVPELSVNDNDFIAGSIEVYPNVVTSGIVNVILPVDNIYKIKVELYDINGNYVNAPVFEAVIDQSGSALQIDMRGTSAGTYLIRIVINNKVYIRKIIVL